MHCTGVPNFVPSHRPPGPSVASYPLVNCGTDRIESAMAQAKGRRRGSQQSRRQRPDLRGSARVWPSSEVTSHLRPARIRPQVSDMPPGRCGRRRVPYRA